MTRSFDKMLVKAFRDSSLQAILDASPAALKGVSEADAQALRTAFGIKTVRDMARNPFFRRAAAVAAAAGDLNHDPGPPPDWTAFLAGAPLDYYVSHPAGRFRLDFGPIYYRGRLDGSARLIVVGQDPAADEALAHRAFVGLSGQRVQGLLSKLGLTRSYILVNTFLFSVFGQFDAALRNISLEDTILAFRNAYLDRLAAENPVQAVIAVGNAAQHAVANWPGHQAFPVFEIMHPAALDNAALLANWNANLSGLLAVVTPDDGAGQDPTPYGAAFRPEDHASIPRFDLPFGVPAWHGTGKHGDRDGNKKIVWTAP